MHLALPLDEAHSAEADNIIVSAADRQVGAARDLGQLAGDGPRWTARRTR